MSSRQTVVPVEFDKMAHLLIELTGVRLYSNQTFKKKREGEREGERHRESER